MTEQSPLERAARALAYEIAGEYPDDGSEVCVQGGFRGADAFKDIARAVLMAIREPSEAMNVAGLEKHGFIDVQDDDAKDCWQAMIDAALEE